MTYSSTLLSLVLLLAISSVGVLSSMARAHGADGLTEFHLYMHEIKPVFAVVKNSTSLGMIGVLDNELRTGPDPSNSTLVGRFQGVVAMAGLVYPPGLQTVMSFVFTSGKYNGSTLVMVGTINSFVGAFERPVVGGTDKFRMARGYCTMEFIPNPPAPYDVYKTDMFFKMD